MGCGKSVLATTNEPQRRNHDIDVEENYCQPSSDSRPENASTVSIRITKFDEVEPVRQSQQDFSFTQSPSNNNVAFRFQKNKRNIDEVGNAFPQSEETPNLGSQEVGWLNIPPHSQFKVQSDLETLKEEPIIEQSKPGPKTNLLETLRSNQPLITDPRTNLLNLLRSQILTPQESESTPLSNVMRPRQESALLSPIYPNHHRRETEQSQQLQIFSTPKQNLLNINESPSLMQEQSFIVEESKVDLDRYNLQVENINVSYQQTLSQSQSQFILSPPKRPQSIQLYSPRRISNFKLLTPNKVNQSINSSAQLMTPTYPECEDQHSINNQLLNHLLIPDQATKKPPSFSHLEQLEAHNDPSIKPLESARSYQSNQSGILQQNSNSQSMLRRFSMIHHVPLETSIMERSKDEKGNKKINNYVILDELGRGGFGKVRLVYCSVKNQYFAMKIANKSKLQKKMLSRVKSAYTLLEQEIAILKKMDHPNTVKLFEVIDDSSEDKLYMIIELMEKGAIGSSAYWTKNQQDPQDTIPLEKLRWYARDFLLGMDYLHNYVQIIHRDIKPDNLLVDENDHIKIADFGVSHIIENDDNEEIDGDQGTKMFLTPEHFQGKKVKGKAADIWASGITFYKLGIGEMPFKGRNLEELKQNVINLGLTFPQDLDPDFQDFLTQMLQKDPVKRATLDQLMEHSWVTKNGEEPLAQEFADERFNVTDMDVRSAITSMTFRGTARLTAKLKTNLKKSRQRIMSRQSIQVQQT